ncbi:hypothetical protein CLAIMM_06835 [Cladophialophora immunda]|nr:hypothetical protein CLAIMM_06835 [Cladophialophora immunda]
MDGTSRRLADAKARSHPDGRCLRILFESERHRLGTPRLPTPGFGLLVRGAFAPGKQFELRVFDKPQEPRVCPAPPGRSPNLLRQEFGPSLGPSAGLVTMHQRCIVWGEHGFSQAVEMSTQGGRLRSNRSQRKQSRC